MKVTTLYNLKVRQSPILDDGNILSIIPKNTELTLMSISGMFFKHEYGWSSYEDDNGDLCVDIDEDLLYNIKTVAAKNDNNKLSEIFLASNDISLYTDITNFYSKYKELIAKYPLLEKDLKTGKPFPMFESNVSEIEYAELASMIDSLKSIFTTNFNLSVYSFSDLLSYCDAYTKTMDENAITSPLQGTKLSTTNQNTRESSEETTETEDEEGILTDAINMDYFNDESDKREAFSLAGKISETRGLIGIPYQYDSVTDPRYDMNTVGDIGWLYYRNYIVAAPILYLTPVRPKFMPGFSKNDKKNLLTSIFNNDESALSLFVNESKSNARYFGTDFATTEYYKRFNTLCQALAIFLGIGDLKVNNRLLGQKLKSADYSVFITGSDISSAFGTKNTIPYYVDSIDELTDSFSNETRSSNLESVLNEKSDTMNEISFIAGSLGGSTLTNLAEGLTDSMSSAVTHIVSKFGVVGKRLAEGLNVISRGGKLILPEIWSDSSYDASGGTSFTMKFVAHNPCKLGWFFDCGIPYMSLLAMTCPANIDSNSYDSPFLVKAYCRNSLSIDMGIISSLEVRKGGENLWSKSDQLPIVLEVSVEIKNLYSSLSISDSIPDLSTNSFCLDFLANLAGVNINKPSFERNIELFKTSLKNTLSPTLFTRYLGIKLEEVSNNAIFGLTSWITGR